MKLTTEGNIVISSGFGSVCLTFVGTVLRRCVLSQEKRKTSLGRYGSHPAVVSLLQYLDGDMDALKGLHLKQEGSLFRQKVWEQMCKIPPGRTMTYGQIADILGSAPRAVGQACGDNQLPIYIPCHRVIGRNGLGGFAHGTIDLPIKRWLLEHEIKHKND